MNIETNGKTYELIDGHTPELKRKIDNGLKRGKLLVWLKGYNDGMHEDKFKVIDVGEISIDILKSVNVWENLPQEVRDRVENKIVEESVAKEEHMEKMRSGRRSKYPNIPKQLTCSICKQVIDIIPSVEAKRCEKMKMLWVDYEKDYKCVTCEPRKKGKRVSEKYAHIPNKLLCTVCNKEVGIIRNQERDRAERLGINWDEYVKGWSCSSCVPRKRGRKKA